MRAPNDNLPPPGVTRRSAFALAWPMMFANVALPLAGVVDTGVIAAVGDKADLGGVALGVTLWNIAYWSFAFLRMGTTGLTAQAAGARDRTSAERAAEIERILLRALAFAAALGVAMMALRLPLAAAGFAILGGEPEVESAGRTYFLARSWGAPAVYASFALTGWLVGVGRTRAVMALQIVFSAVNVVLDLWFVLGLGWGVAGVAAATAIADWVAAAAATGLAWPTLRAMARLGAGGAWSVLRDGRALRGLASLNADLMVRSWALLFGFSWFTNAAARQSAAVLAGSHVLLQIVTVWAFVLDAWALAAETAAGRAIGAGSVVELRRALRVLGELAIGSGALFLVATLGLGPPLLELWVADGESRAAALRFLPYCAVVPLVGSAAWLLDGVFIGATAGVAMRNAAFASTALYIVLDLVLGRALGPHGMWSAFLCYYLARAGTLLVAYPALERRVSRRGGN
jgi:MATE family multidrug resistance protein